MCVGVPMRVLSAAPGVALCEGRGRRAEVGMLLTGDQPVGTWILAYQGSAVRTMSAGEAAETNSALDALEAALAGDADLDRYFADLAQREPQLPAHLKGS